MDSDPQPDDGGPAPGMAGSITMEVTADDTAVALRSGDVPVLATPRVVALAEEAACAAIEGQLELDQTSVGVTVTLHHLRASQVGAEVTAAATLTAVDGRKLDFTISVREGEDEVASGTHRRVVVSRAAFGG